MAYKKFGQLNDEDTLYYIDPLTGNINGLKIKYIAGVPAEEAVHNIGSRYYVKITCYRNDVLLHSPDLTKIPTIDFLLDGRLDFQMAIGQVQVGPAKVPMPIPYSSDKKLLEDFIGSSAKTDTRKFNG